MAYRSIESKIWRRWSNKRDPMNTNQIAKKMSSVGAVITEPEVHRIITAYMARPKTGRIAKLAVIS